MHKPSPPSRTGPPVSGSHPFDDRKPLPFDDVDRADGPAGQIDRPRRGDPDRRHLTARLPQRLDDQRLRHRPHRLGVTLGRGQLRAVHQRAVGVDEACGDLGAADVEGEGDVVASSVFVGVVGLTGIAGVFVAWRQFDQRRAPGVEPDAKAASTGGREQDAR